MEIPYDVKREIDTLYEHCSRNVQRCVGLPAGHPMRAKVAEVNQYNMQRIMELEAPYSSDVVNERDQFVGGKPSNDRVS